MEEIYPNLDDIFDQIDLRKGDVVLFSSNIMKIWCNYRRYHHDYSPDKIIGCIQERITSDGTLLLPAYSWDFCHGKGFDYRNTPPETGSITKAALDMDGFLRTRHPIYSYAVWGAKRDFFVGLNNQSAWDSHSPFYYLHQMNGYQIMFGVSFSECFTFAHYVEEAVGVPYRYIKDFTDHYIDRDGTDSIRTYSMYVRDYDANITYDSELEEKWWGSQIVDREIACYGAKIRRIPLVKAFDVIKEDILHNQSRHFAHYKGQDPTKVEREE